MIQWQHELVTI